jgi:transcription-repair coupling factor (superfamily II helicase)
MSDFSFELQNDLQRTLRLERKLHSLTGISALPGFASLFAHSNSDCYQGLPHLIVFSDAQTMFDFERDLSFFRPEVFVSKLSAFDVSPYSGLYPNPRLTAERLQWLGFARRARAGDIFLCVQEALAQWTLPLKLFDQKCFTIKKGQELPSDYLKQLSDLGYQISPRVEDLGQASSRGGIFDIFSPGHTRPIRMELFGDTVESMKYFDPSSQRREEDVDSLIVLPAKEVLFSDENRQRSAGLFKKSSLERGVPSHEFEPILHDIVHARHFNSVEFLLDLFYTQKSLPFHYFRQSPLVWFYDTIQLQRSLDLFQLDLSKEFKTSSNNPICPEPKALFDFGCFESIRNSTQTINVSRVLLDEGLSDEPDNSVLFHSVQKGQGFSLSGSPKLSDEDLKKIRARLLNLRAAGYSLFISSKTNNQAQRIKLILESVDLYCVIIDTPTFEIQPLIEFQSNRPDVIHIILKPISESSLFVKERIALFKEDDFFGKKTSVKSQKPTEDFAKAIQFSDLKLGDLVVHIDHGVGVFLGLKVIEVDSIPAEFIEIQYKDNDKLYLPVYRISKIQKFSGVGVVDKLGSQAWLKTKIKVQNQLRDIASELLELYARRSQLKRPAFHPPDEDYRAFEASFPYEETDDQIKAINDVLNDMTAEKPMDRLICGDVGFGKTEVALRAAFKAVEDRKQVALIVPTTVLAFQHLETFKKRFSNWPVRVAGLSRFTEKPAARKTVEGLKDGSVDIVIGTHRLLSKDIEFKDLGVLIIDEEQRFGVTHKEKLKKIKASVDTLTLSATPIPRTLNMGLVGMRDLSLINSAPVDRVPTRTFVCRYEDETIRKAITSELQRGGQVFFVHNRVQSIHELSNQIRALVPEARIVVGHGQMGEDDLEKVMLDFVNHDYDVLICTTIIESGIDIPRANTIIIDRAHTFGLSQLYQLRGRVGRSKERAFCYLLVPSSGTMDAIAQERLRVIQENSALGSGFKIAHHDLELRGAGNILGDSQSGHANSVGYELYLELLEDTVRTIKGEDLELEKLDPELNIKIPALIPDQYMPDIRLRLGYYKTLSKITSAEDVDKIEEELRDQFGPPPESVYNLMGLMLIRHNCKSLGIRDLSSSSKSLSLAFIDKTPMKVDIIIGLATRQAKKYSITPDSRLVIRMEKISWPVILEELSSLKRHLEKQNAKS